MRARSARTSRRTPASGVRAMAIRRATSFTASASTAGRGSSPSATSSRPTFRCTSTRPRRSKRCSRSTATSPRWSSRMRARPVEDHSPRCSAGWPRSTLAMQLMLARYHRLLREKERERAAQEERIRHQAYHDALTGLPNRASFAEHLDEAMRAREARRLAARAAVPRPGPLQERERQPRPRRRRPPAARRRRAHPALRCARPTCCSAWAATSSPCCSRTCAGRRRPAMVASRVLEAHRRAAAAAAPRDLGHRERRHRALPARRRGRPSAW